MLMITSNKYLNTSNKYQIHQINIKIWQVCGSGVVGGDDAVVSSIPYA